MLSADPDAIRRLYRDVLDHPPDSDDLGPD